MRNFRNWIKKLQDEFSPNFHEYLPGLTFLFYSNIAVFKTHTRSIDLILDPFTYV